MSRGLRKALDINPDDGREVVQVDQSVNDFDFARSNMLELIGKGQEALEDMIDLARQSQDPKAYNVLNNLLKNTAEINRELVDLHKTKKEPLSQDSEGPSTVNNNLYVTTADLLKMINKEDTEEHDPE